MTIILAGEPQLIADRIESEVGDFTAAGADPDLAIKRLTGSEIDDLAELKSDLAASSMFSRRQLIIIRHLEEIVGLGKSDAKTITDQTAVEVIDDLLRAVNPANTLIATVGLDNGPGSKVAKPAWYKHIAKETTKSGVYDFVYHQSLTGLSLVKWLIKRGQTKGINIDQPLATALINQRGEEMVALATEIDKLRYHQEVDVDLISRIVVSPLPVRSIFDLTNSLIDGNLGRSLAIYNDLKSYDSRPASLGHLIRPIIWQLRLLLAVKTRADRSLHQLATDLAVSQYPLQKTAPLANRLSLSQLATMIENCRWTDYQIRVLWSNPDDCLQNLIVKICRP